MTKISINIPQPCHENWQTMTPEDKGRFCASCQKKVFDFTRSSDREIVTAFEQNQNLCGRFLNNQLNRDLNKPEQKSTVWIAVSASIISLTGLQEVTAQEPVKTEQTDQRILLGKPAYVKPSQIEVSGVVVDEKGFPIAAANITVKGTTISTQADLDGKFRIKALKNDILVFSFIGNETKEINVTQDQINVILKDDVHMLGEIVVVKKRTLFGRFFHWVGNLFR